MGKGTNSDCFHVRKCAVCGKELVVTHSIMMQGTFVKLINGRKHYCCGWKCFREFKYQMLMKKKNLTLEDKNWLKFARFI